MRVDLTFNDEQDPRLLRIEVDGVAWSTQRNRLADYMIGQPISRWVAPYVSGFKAWQGAVAELQATFNTRRFEWWVYGPETAAIQLREAARKQTACQCDVHWVEPPQTADLGQRLEALEQLADGRIARRDIRGLRKMIESLSMRVIYDAAGLTGFVQINRPDWVFSGSRLALPLALVQAGEEAEAVRQAAEMGGINARQLTVCAVDVDIERCGRTCEAIAACLPEAHVLAWGDVAPLGLPELREVLTDALTANADACLSELMRSAPESDWLDAVKARLLVRGA